MDDSDFLAIFLKDSEPPYIMRFLLAKRPYRVQVERDQAEHSNVECNIPPGVEASDVVLSSRRQLRISS